MKNWTKDTAGYDEERQGFQRLNPHRPAKIIGTASSQDVQAAVDYARQNQLKVAVKASGHGHTNPLDGGVLITTNRLDKVTVDPDAKTASIQAGATWQQVIEATAPHGLAPLSGSFPGVGAVPYTLGGGTGLMARRYGFAADHVRRIELVTPDGQLRVADGDLFWALRGGGGNFGVVTELEIDLFDAPTLYGGSLYYDLMATPDALEVWREWTQTVPDEVTSAAAALVFPDIPPVPAPLRGKHIAQLQLSITTSAEARGAAPRDDLARSGEALVRALRDRLGEPTLDTVGEIPYSESAKIFAEPERPDAYGSHNVLLSDLDPQTLSTITKLAGPDAPTMCVLGIRHLDGALAQPPAIPNAIGHRDAQYSLTVLTPGKADRSRTHHQILAPAKDRTIGRSLNFSFNKLTEAEVREAYNPTDYDRLKTLKAEYDPTNLLLPNHVI